MPCFSANRNSLERFRFPGPKFVRYALKITVMTLGASLWGISPSVGSEEEFEGTSDLRSYKALQISHEYLLYGYDEVLENKAYACQNPTGPFSQQPSEKKYDVLRGFSLAPEVLSYEQERLTRLVEGLKKENDILAVVSEEYSVFLKEVSGWGFQQWRNYLGLSQKISQIQAKINLSLNEKNLGKKDVAADEGKGSRTEEIRQKLFRNIKRLPDNPPSDGKDRHFQKIYLGEDERERVNPEEGNITFERIKVRKRIVDEKRHAFILTSKDIKPGQAPEIKNSDMLMVLKGIEMAEEYPGFDYVAAHRMQWPEVMKELLEQHAMKPNTNESLEAVWEDHFLESNIATYNELYGKYEKLLGENMTLLRELFLPYAVRANAYTTRIPRGWKFFISETYRNDEPVSGQS